MLPNVTQPTRVRLPDGRQATITVTLDGERPEIVTLPFVPAPEQPPRPERKGKKGRPTTKTVPRTEPRVAHATLPAQPPPEPGRSPLDEQEVGGRLTLFVLLYGDHHDLHRRCLEAVLATTRAERLSVRVAGNAVCGASREWLNALKSQGRLEAFYDNHDNRKKYPVMREVLRDPALPVTTRWLVWFDDDTVCDRNPRWLELLAKEIADGRRLDPRLGMVGPKYIYGLKPAQAEWLKAAPWYRGRPFRDAQGRPAPNGAKVHFATGSFWALKTECVTACDIPDARLGHNGGDWTIGEQLYQHGYTLRSFSANKTVVNWSSVPRRGLSEKHPGQ
jgi:hypothetical protein